MSNRTALRFRTVSRLPAKLTGTNGVKVTPSNNDYAYVVSSDTPSLIRTPSIVDLDTTFFQAYNSLDGSYGKLSGFDFVAALQSVIIGPNLTGIANLTVGANQVPYYLDNLGNASTYTVSPYMRGISTSVDGPTLLSNINALAITSGIYRIDQFSNAPSNSIPNTVNRLSIEDRRMFMSRKASQPVGPLKFQNGAQWWGADEIIIDATMAGCKADGVTNDTAALNALFYAGFPIHLGGKDRVYLVDNIDWTDRNAIVPIYGYGAIIKKRTNNGKPLLQINNNAASGYVAPNTIDGIVFDANHLDNYSVLAYNIARWRFSNCRFLNANTDGFLQLGGAGTVLTKVDAMNNGRAGLAFDQYNNGSGPIFPNFNLIHDSGIFDNSQYGIYFDSGRCLSIETTDIEGNGTAGNVNCAGIWVGGSVGTESGTTLRPGVLIKDCWIEGNLGATAGGAGNQSGAVRLGSGFNRIDRVYTVANGTYCDVLADGGTYDISSSAFDGARTHVVDTSGTGYGNVIRFTKIGGVHAIDPLKTSVFGFANNWQAYTPTLTADSGTIGSTSYALGRYQVIGRNVMVNLSVGIGTAGTATGDLMISLPFAPKLNTSVAGVYNNGGLTGVAPTNQYYVRVRKATDGTSIIANSRDITVSFTFEMA